MRQTKHLSSRLCPTLNYFFGENVNQILLTIESLIILLVYKESVATDGHSEPGCRLISSFDLIFY